MVGNTLGTYFRVTTWGESHGPALGCVIDGCPAGLEVNQEDITRELARDRSGPLGTSRAEKNEFQLLSGIFEGKTIGTPISIIIKNKDVKPKDYESFKFIPRPGHADLAYYLKYRHIDWRGGSRASGRVFIPFIAAGAIAKQLLKLLNIKIFSQIIELGGKLYTEKNKDEIIMQLNEQIDSSGGIVELSIKNLPAGLGFPLIQKFHTEIGQAILSISGVKSFEIGAGKDVARMTGSQNNDPLAWDENGNIYTITNNSGGVLGGITTGMPFICRYAVKPPSSIPIPQQTVNLKNKKSIEITLKGRFDKNFTARTQVIAEALAAIVCVDHLILNGFISPNKLLDSESSQN
ncbi:MAG: chorismate synthase [Candidatus Hermodarchaeota archaeon]